MDRKKMIKEMLRKYPAQILIERYHIPESEIIKITGINPREEKTK